MSNMPLLKCWVEMYKFFLQRTDRKWLYLFLLQIPGHCLQAQQETGDRTREWSADAAFSVVRQRVTDKSFSSVPYSAYITGYALSVQTQAGKLSQHMEFFFAAGNLSPSFTNMQDLHSTYFTIDYTALYKLGGSGMGSLLVVRAGGSLGVLSARRKYGGFINDNLTSEFAAMLGPAVELSYSFEDWLKGFSITERINLPVASYLSQPSFAGENSKDNTRLAGFGSFFGSRAFTSLERVITHTQKISVAYTWDYYQIRGPRPVVQANHRIGLNYSLKF